MKIPNNSLTEDIKEIVTLCEKLAAEYGKDASWFMPPLSDKIIAYHERKHNYKIPETYKEWLHFSSEAQIRNTLAHFYPPNKFVLNSKELPEDFIILADLVGDSEMLCFSKITGEFIWVDHGKYEIMPDFGVVLSEIIRMLKAKSSLSPKMEKLLMKMVDEKR